MLERAGLSVSQLARNSIEAMDALFAFTELDLHRLVALFLAARFPILLALNKVFFFYFFSGCLLLLL